MLYAKRSFGAFLILSVLGLVTWQVIVLVTSTHYRQQTELQIILEAGDVLSFTSGSATIEIVSDNMFELRGSDGQAFRPYDETLSEDYAPSRYKLDKIKLSPGQWSFLVDGWWPDFVVQDNFAKIVAEQPTDFTVKTAGRTFKALGTLFLVLVGLLISFLIFVNLWFACGWWGWKYWYRDKRWPDRRSSKE
jgi:hypothetical protein